MQNPGFKNRTSEVRDKKSFVPLGAVALILGLVGFVQEMKDAFDAIAAAGDISPSIVVAGISEAYTYPALGLVTLAVSFLFKYLNQ